MMCAYYPKERLIPFSSEGKLTATTADFSTLSHSLIRAKVDIGALSTYSDSGTQAVLDKLLDGGHITAVQYLEQLPAGALLNREALLEKLKNEGSADKEVTDNG